MKATKLPSGSWTVNAYVNGVRRRFTGPDRRQVLADAADWVNENKAERSRGTFLGAANEFLLEREEQLSPATIRGYNNVLRQLKKNYPRLCSRECIAITTWDLQDVVDDLLDSELSVKTVRNYMGFVSSVLAYKRVRMPVVDIPSGGRAQLNIPDEFTVKRLLSITWDKKDRQLWTCIALAACGPLRRGEICALREEDVDFEAGTIHVSHDIVMDKDGNWIMKEPKTESSDRLLPMEPKIMEQIRAQGFFEKEGFEGRFVVSFTPKQLTNKFTWLLSSNGITHFRFHDLRHYCASMLHAKGYPDAYIQARTGHAGTEVLRRVYTHALSDERVRIEAEMMEDFSRLLSN